MNSGPLHVYRSVFGCGFVLRGVELAAVQAVKPADEAAVAVVAVAAAVGVDPLPVAIPEVELEARGAAPAAVETISPPEAAQEEPQQEEEVGAAPAVVDKGLPPMAAQEMELEDLDVEEAAPTAVMRVSPPEAAPEEPQREEEVRAAPAVVDEGLPLMAAQEDEVDETEEEEAAGAAPMAMTRVSPPAAAPEDATGGEETAEGAGSQAADRSPPLAADPKRRRLAMGVWTAITAMLAVAGLQYPEIASGFTAYDCANTTNSVDVYSLLEPAACPTTTSHHSVERTIFGKIVQIKTERRVPVYPCSVIETVITQYCGFLSAGGVPRYLKFREPNRVEAQDCRLARTRGGLTAARSIR